MFDNHIAVLQPPLRASLVRVDGEGIDEALRSGELLWCCKTDTGDIVASSLAPAVLAKSPAEHLAPRHAGYSLVDRVARQAVQIDQSCVALSIIHNSFVLSGIDIGAIAERREQGRSTAHDLSSEERIEAILWAAARSTPGTASTAAATRMYRSLPWAQQAQVSIVHVDLVETYSPSELDIALTG